MRSAGSAANQIELRPYVAQPMGRQPIPASASWGEGRGSVMDDPWIRRIAEAHGRTPAQVMLRWHLQQGRSAIPKSTNLERIAQNFDVFDFALTDAELSALDDLDLGIRGGPGPDEVDPSTWDLAIPDA